jgi:hypothetical protein
LEESKGEASMIPLEDEALALFTDEAELITELRRVSRFDYDVGQDILDDEAAAKNYYDNYHVWEPDWQLDY